MINASTTDGVGLVELDRPDRRNALDAATCRALVDALAEVRADGARAVVLTGAGTSFCSGADFADVYTDGFRDALYAALHAVTALPVPVIAAVNGPAIGAGTQLAIAADLRVADPSATFGLPTARLGLAVDPWTVQRLVQVAGGGSARALLLACLRLDAATALARGLVDVVAEDAPARERALEMAADVATMAPLTLAYNKSALDAFGGAGDDAAALQGAFERCWSSDDLEEGRRARSEKRAPQFQGR